MLFAVVRRQAAIAGAFLLICGSLYAASISGTIKDSSGAFVPGAVVTITAAGASSTTVKSDGHGNFVSPDLPPGTYQVHVQRPGFAESIRQVDLGTAPVTLDFQLVISAQRQELTVSGRGGTYANSDSTYRALRAIALGTSFTMKPNTVLKADVGTFTFRSGTISFLQPIHGVNTGAIFIGDGQLAVTPIMPIDKAELRRRTKSEVFEEDFSEAVFRFTNGANRALVQLVSGEAETPREAQAVLSRWRDMVRHRHEEPQSALEALLTGEDIDNTDADILSFLYNPRHPSFFAAYLRGKRHSDLRFFIRDRGGAVPQLDSPEEVALVNYAPGNLDEGIWYLAHRKTEYEHGAASSQEDRRFVSARRFKIETVIARNDHLASIASIELQPLVDGERVVKFHLLPNLRVSRVADAAGKELFYIQEDRKADASFYVIFPEPCELGKTYRISIEYSGDRVIHDAGTGSFYVGARECWYPTPNLFNENSSFDLTFRVPRQFTVISVGNLEHASEEDRMAVSHWVTPGPIAVAGFNYGAYKHTQLVDDQTHTTIDGYYLAELPDYLRNAHALQALAPGSMTKYALQVARAELQLCNYYFGPDNFQRLYLTEQPNFAFGQSWPNLVYLPISAYIDSTQRYLLFGGINNQFSAFVQEVTPHEVSHQWWGHAVGWASYHDQWLSEGFAEFSAALFIQQGQGPGHDDEYRQFWDRLRKEIIEKGAFGESPNDAGPLWLGSRLASPRNESATRLVIYPKGAFVLNMLRSLMWGQEGDKAFTEMMHDFVAAHKDRPASTESFKAIAEKHMLKSMDLDGNGRLDWFFNEWVYGTEIPRYTFKFGLAPPAGGHVKATMTLTQSDVSPQFSMAVPLYAKLAKDRLVRMGAFTIRGSTSKTVNAELPLAAKALVLDPYHEVLQR